MLLKGSMVRPASSFFWKLGSYRHGNELPKILTLVYVIDMFGKWFEHATLCYTWNFINANCIKVWNYPVKSVFPLADSQRQNFTCKYILCNLNIIYWRWSLVKVRVYACHCVGIGNFCSSRRDFMVLFCSLLCFEHIAICDSVYGETFLSFAMGHVKLDRRVPRRS